MNIVISKKIKEKYFAEILRGYKKFEIRKEDDCTYHVNDILILEEINNSNMYTGRIAVCKITYVLRNFEGLHLGYVALGIELKHTFNV